MEVTKNERFKIIHKQGMLASSKILVDTETGVNYFFHCDGYGGGLTVLLDKDGKPVVTPLSELED